MVNRTLHRRPASVTSLSLPSTSMTRRAPLELAYVPRGVEEPLLGYYSVTPLTPGGWADLLGDVGLPDTLRRLSQGRRRGGRPSQGRDAVPADAAAARLPPDRARRAVERLGACLAAGGAGRRAVVLGGGGGPDLGRFAAAFPPPATRPWTRRARSPPRRPPGGRGGVRRRLDPGAVRGGARPADAGRRRRHTPTSRPQHAPDRAPRRRRPDLGAVCAAGPAARTLEPLRAAAGGARRAGRRLAAARRSCRSGRSRRRRASSPLQAG